MEIKKRKRSDKIIDVLLLFASIIMILVLVVVLIGALRYWSDLISQVDKNATGLRYFLIANVITFVSVIAQWIEGRIRSIIELVPNITNRPKSQSELEGGN